MLALCSVAVAGDQHMPGQANFTPFQIAVDTRDRTAWLINISTGMQYVFVDSLRQPAILRLYSVDGMEIPAFDERTRMKFDNEIHGRDSFAPLASHQRMKLLEWSVKRSDGLYELLAGEFSFAGLAAGKYAAMVEWHSERNRYLDDSNRVYIHKLAWLGKVELQRVEIDIR